jgi:hypothetical protein
VTEKQIDNAIDLIQDAIRHIPGQYSRSHPEGVAPPATTAILTNVVGGTHRDGDGPHDIVDARSGLTDHTPLGARPAPQEPLGSLTEVDLNLGLKVQVVRDLLLGESGCRDRRSAAGLVGIDIDDVYVAFRARTRPGHRIKELAAELGLSASPCGEMLVAEFDGDVIGLLPEAPSSVTAGVVGVGPAAQPDELIESFPLASRAMEAAIAFDLTGVHAFGDLGLLPAIVADTEVGEALSLRYVRPLDDVERGAEIVLAIRTWLGCGMHVDSAAAELVLHPNTVRNRIARFEDLVGVDLRDAAAAMQVWWALHFDALAGSGSLRPSLDADPTA